MILVTGGAGFIGSNLVAALEARGEHNITIVDYFGADDKWRNIAKREVSEIITPDQLPDYLEQRGNEINGIFHLGAISATTERDVDLIVRTNIVLSTQLWRWCAKRGVRFIYASSAATYGNGEQGFIDWQKPDQLAQLRPLNAYGWSKHSFDRHVARWVDGRKTSPVQWAGLKFFNVFGPNEAHKGDMMSVVAKLYPDILAGKAARLFKSYRPDVPDGGQSRDFIYVKDCVSVMLWLWDNPRISGLFNVGTGVARSFYDLAKATATAAGKELVVEFIEKPLAIRDKYQYFTAADTNKLRSAGYSQPFTSLEDGIHDYVNSYLATDDPYA